MQRETKWATKFTNSLKRYHAVRAAGPDGTISTSLRRSSLTLGGFCKFSPEVAESFLNALAEQSIRLEAMEVIDALDGVCESPIEMAMSLALWIAARDEVDSVCYLLDGKAYGQTEGQRSLTIQPQQQLGTYRVDFSLAFIDGQQYRSMVVECDGRAFHDRTHEQAARDRQRDRRLQAMGFYVFRYAGSEIWADVFACASEAIQVLTSHQQTASIASSERKQPQSSAPVRSRAVAVGS